MDQSPRKRVTRARVAARAAAAAESNSKSINKVIMTASKAGPTTTNIISTTSSISSSSKRKIQNDEVIRKREIEKIANRKIKRAGIKPESEIKAKPEPESKTIDNLATKKPTRGRPRKALQTENLPPRTLRGRVTRATNVEEKKKTSSLEEKIPKRRGKLDTVNTTITTITKPSGPKRYVKFEGPGKENINPSTKNSEKDIIIEEVHGSGFRAKPLRKPVSTTRATRGRSKPIQQDGIIKSSNCLAMKKLDNIDDTSSKTLATENSDDELTFALNKTTPHSPLKACPIRPTTNVFNASEESNIHSSTIAKILEPKNSKTHDEMKGVITSPARRPPQTPLRLETGANTQSLGTVSSVLRSSKPTKMFIPTINSEIPINSNTASLLQSPARRFPQYQDKLVSDDEYKSNPLPAIVDQHESNSDDFQAPCRAVTPKSARIPKHRKTRSEIKSSNIGPELVSHLENPKDSNHNLDDELIISEPNPIFSGRMSCIVPRDIDPTFAAESVTQETKSVMDAPQQEFTKTIQILENLTNSSNDEVNNNTPSSFSPYGNKYNPFMLRRDVGCTSEDSDSEDELSSNPAFSRNVFVAPSPYPRFGGITPRSNFTGQIKRNEGIGFTPLAQKLNHWMTTSPGKKQNAKVEFSETLTTIWDNEPKWADASIEYQDDTVPSLQSISDDEVKFSNQKMVQLTPTPMEIDSVQDKKQFELEETEIDEEDLELALEANEMSLLEPSQINTPDDMFFSEKPPQGTVDHRIMTGSQMKDGNILGQEKNLTPQINEISSYEVNNIESQDLSDMVIDPRLLALPPQTVNTSFMTPKRTYTERVYHTVCKVPLKPAASDTPEKPIVTRSASASRMVSTCSTTFRNQTGKVYNSSGEKLTQESVLITPNKQVIDWSSLGTPARTPRPDLNRSLLKGAVVYVDVYTTEGADASVIFIELLTQMGARCIKSWSWNGNIEESKIGITHVIYKDGGKRTLEKIRESDGVVLCVGVAWVLDCERENKWLDETPYFVDIDVFPRGGGRRRKSMEPRALANMNGTLIPCPNTARPSQRRCFSGDDSNRTINEGEETPMTSKSHRRDSVQWLRTKVPEEGETPKLEDKNKDENSNFISFLPPFTPSGVVNEKKFYDQNYSSNKFPSDFDGSIASREKYGGSPMNYEEDDEEPYFLQKEKLQQKTAPVKRRFYDAELHQDTGNSNSNIYSSNNDNSNRFGGVCNNNSSSSTTIPTASMNIAGTAPETYDYGFMMRLKAARRKSLQWAPKIGSPLARAF
ncbi:hypothetical protein EPUL_001085 [Erysiphe pulchra]|uniref:BRCT domain-containing protein n=1 Tax=Erysiphe pulchra TaxID=225359 RepID=A0A2S4Q1F7_9PEZI|nr:hypothetical protein EPUL_001085 [Erysiphe pulchra]